MVMAINGVAAARKSYDATSSNGQARWYTDYMGGNVPEVEDKPQSNLIEMGALQTIVPHFHQVNQFQIFVGGTGRIGRNDFHLVALHYADHHTAYGPIHAGPNGLALFTLRAQSDPGAIYLDKPGYKERLKPSKRRYLIAEGMQLSVGSVMRRRHEPVIENVLDKETDTSDGLGALMLRIGADAHYSGPDPGATGGQYYLVLNGSLRLAGELYPFHSLVFVGRKEAALDVQAGPEGLEALVLNLPRFEQA